MSRIVTLTLNPTIDGSSDAETVQHTRKVRTSHERFDPGGGGINVARVLARLGSDCEAVYLAGGVTGPVLGGLLDRAGLNHRVIPIAGDTRVSLAVHERQSGKEYRFVPQGPQVSEVEYRRCLESIGTLECSWLVLSGSLPPGVPDDFYGRVVEIARRRGIAVVLDTSGAALKATLAQGGVRLVKPSLGELEQLAGRPLPDRDQVVAAAQDVVASGGAETVAISMGHRGALLVEAGRVLALPALPVEARSAVGAGDSFVAAMTFGLAAGWESERAFRLGLAAGTAAVLTPGTDLCHRADIERFAAAMGVDMTGHGGPIQ
jgi:6-phosphofructokinase 2